MTICSDWNIMTICSDWNIVTICSDRNIEVVFDITSDRNRLECSDWNIVTNVPTGTLDTFCTQIQPIHVHSSLHLKC
jgi:hypothetical protein